MKNKGFLISLLAVAVLVAGYFVWQSMQTKGDVNVKVGVILPLTGDAASYGQSLKRGLDLTRTEGIELIYEDSKAEPKTAVNAVTKLIAFDKVDMIIGDMFTHTTLAINPIVNKAQIPLITPTASASELTETSDYTFRLYPSEKEEAKVLVDFYKDSFYKGRAAIFVANEDAMLKVAQIIEKGLDEVSIQAVEYQKGTKDFNTLINKINDEASVVFLIGYLEESILLIKQFMEQNRKVDFIALSTLYTPTLGDLIEGIGNNIYVATPYFKEDKNDTLYGMFYESYYKAYNSQPDVWAGYGYDAGNIVNTVISQSNVDKTDIISKIYNLQNYSGVTGEININKDRSIQKTMTIKLFKDNKFKDVN